MKKISFYLAILIAFLTLSCQKETLTVATTGGISGSVLDSESSSALSGVEITISGSDLSTTSGSSGAFSFSDLAAGSYTLTASLSGYISTSESVTVKAGETSTLNFSLVAQEENVFELDLTSLAFEAEGGRFDCCS
ncbi:MAG: carboxypeptidase regulatory-like domain-containing protein [Rikenellaceae bacterium]